MEEEGQIGEVENIACRKVLCFLFFSLFYFFVCLFFISFSVFFFFLNQVICCSRSLIDFYN